MKKNVLALSIAAMIGGLGFAGAASAQLTVNDSGTGHILLVPYFTAQDGNMSVFHVVNTDTKNGKAVKVRFRGAANSDDILDFQLFLSPGDVWAAAVTKGEDGRAQLSTTDNSCTLPTVKGAAVPFVTDRLPNVAADAKANHTREGYVEILNMADIDGSTIYGAQNNANSSLYTATKHVNNVAPCTSSVLNDTLGWTHATASATTGLLAPTGGLTGSWYIVNVPQTTVFSGATAAITAGTTQNVFSPQANASSGALLETADPLFRAKVLELQAYDVPDLSTPIDTAYATPEAHAAALTTALAHTSVINQYAQDAAVSGKTDWVFSLPTRRYNIAANYAASGTTGTATVNAAGTVAGTIASAYRVINTDTGTWFTANNTTVSGGLICLSSISQKFYNREEDSVTTGAVFSPGNVSKLPLCGETNVLSFPSGSVLGSAVANSGVGSGTFTNGWGEVTFGGAGVPVLGYAAIKATNPAASAGVSGTYGVTWPHTYRKAP